MRRIRKERRPRRSITVMLTCILALPTVSGIVYGWDIFPSKEALLPYLLAGALLGLAHLLLRPALRLLSLPIGCLTLGLSGLAIDIGLIYFCSGCVPDYPQQGFLCVLLTALLINTITAYISRR